MGETWFIVCTDCNTVDTIDKDDALYEMRRHVGHNFLILTFDDFDNPDSIKAALESILSLSSKDKHEWLKCEK